MCWRVVRREAQGAKIVQASWGGGTSFMQTMYDEIKALGDAGACGCPWNARVFT